MTSEEYQTKEHIFIEEMVLSAKMASIHETRVFWSRGAQDALKSYWNQFL